MKVYSDQVVSKEDLTAIDQKQTKQIMQLRMWFAGVTVVNFLAVGACFFVCRM